jgi:hypothetical protein
MKKLSKNAFLDIKNWIYRNARPLDLAVWKYHFENENIENIIKILQFYQNNDKGLEKQLIRIIGIYYFHG